MHAFPRLASELGAHGVAQGLVEAARHACEDEMRHRGERVHRSAVALVRATVALVEGRPALERRTHGIRRSMRRSPRFTRPPPE